MSLRCLFMSLVALATFPLTAFTTSLAGSVTLTWSTPGDDGLTGCASSFDLRYSRERITPGNFSQATAVANLPSPGVPGSTQSVTVDALDCAATYFFAMKSVDDASNWSDLSNVASLTPWQSAGVEVPLVLRFSAPRPNPAREEARFSVELPAPSWIRVEVFDVGGRRVRRLLDQARLAGIESLAFDLREDRGSRLAQGIYPVRAQLGETAISQRLVVTR
jgi:hypothetical protein